MKPLNLLFTSAGRRSYLIKYFKEALDGQGKVYAANSSALSSALEVADEGVVTPIIYSDEYIPFLLNFCKEHHIDALMSLFDVDLPVLAANKEHFEEIGTKVIVSDPEVIDICNDKWKSFCFIRDNGFSAIPTYLQLDEALSALERSEIRYPLIIKPRWGMGSIAVYEAENEEELRVFYNKARNDVFASYLKYESAMDVDNSILIQQKIEGQEYGMDNICDLSGNYITTIIRKKIAMRSGETDCAEVVDDPQLRKTAERLAKLTKHVGNMDMDVIVSQNTYYILEMNARFGGGYPFSHIAGVNLPEAMIRWLRNQPVDPAVFCPTYGVVAQKDLGMIALHPRRFSREDGEGC